MSDDENEEKSNEIGSFIWDSIGAIPFFLMFITIILYIITYSSPYDKTLKSIDPSLVDEDGGKSKKGVITTGVVLGIVLALLQAMRTGNII